MGQPAETRPFRKLVHSGVHIGRSILGNLSEMASPGQCAECGHFSASRWLCEGCKSKAGLADDTWCSHCAMPPWQPHTPGCRRSEALYQNHALPWLEARTLGSYQGVLRSACLSGKKAHGAWANRQLAIHWLEMHKSWLVDQKPVWIVPIPRHWTRKWLAGHDPADAIARELARQAGSHEIQLAHFLKRRQATPHLAQLNSKERFETMRKGFLCHQKAGPSLEKISSVLLVDDILTTGATAMAAAFALREAGAGKILVAAMTRTLENVD